MDDHSLYRDPANGRIAGVCAGLAEYLELGSGLIRILFILLVFVTTPVLAILIYAILALVLPARPSRLGMGYSRTWRRY